MSFETSLDLPIAAAEAFAWHARPGAFDRLTPPWLETEIVQDSNGIAPGSRLIFRVRRGPLWVRWVAEHRDTIEGERFTDVQISGPFAHWQHLHRFAPIASGSRLEDRIHYALPLGALSHRLLGHFLQADLERMFRYRHRTTGADLEFHQRYADRRRQRIAIAGGGEVGRSLAAFLSTGGHQAMLLRRGVVRRSYEIGEPPGEGPPLALAGADAWVELSALRLASETSSEPALDAIERRLGWFDRVGEPARTFLLALPLGLDPAVRRKLETLWQRAPGRTLILDCGRVLTGDPGTRWPRRRREPESWISVDDAIAAVGHLLLDDRLEGTFQLARGREAEPGALEASGFRWRHPHFEQAVAHLGGRA